MTETELHAGEPSHGTAMHHGLRNAIPAVYAVLVVVGFLISGGVGIAVGIVGAMVGAVLWSLLSETPPADGTTGPRADRAAARSARRNGRR